MKQKSYILYLVLFAIGLSVSACHGSGGGSSEKDSAVSKNESAEPVSTATPTATPNGGNRSGGNGGSGDSDSGGSDSSDEITQKGDGVVGGSVLVSQTEHYKIILTMSEPLVTTQANSSGGSYLLSSRLIFGD